MANPLFASESYYHIYNRGVEKRNVFLGRPDYMRFLETLDYYRMAPQSRKLSDFRRMPQLAQKTGKQYELVRIYCYCLMPNHFHLLLQQISNGGITQFMRKLSDSYTRYFNTKYDRVGPLFQGTFKAKFIENEQYLLQLSKYIHRNLFVLSPQRRKADPCSSYRAYVSGEAHLFCDTEFILSYFSKTHMGLGYRAFVEDSDVDDPRVFELLIDSEGY